MKLKMTAARSACMKSALFVLMLGGAALAAGGAARAASTAGFPPAAYGYGGGHPVSYVSGSRDSSPMAAGAQKFVSSMGERALSFLRNSQMGQGGKEEQFRRLLESSFDMDTIARFTLGQYWRQLDDGQKHEYLRLFREWVVKVYSARFSQYTDQDFKTTGARVDSDTDTIVSSSVIPRQGEPVEVDWRVRYKNGRYQIVDVVVENISMSQTQRSDFLSVIQQGGGNISALLDHLRQNAG
jgi:phospholipid transport system substrate-binding protein